MKRERERARERASERKREREGEGGAPHFRCETHPAIDTIS